MKPIRIAAVIVIALAVIYAFRTPLLDLAGNVIGAAILWAYTDRSTP
jgi:hypothetical protein